MKRKYACILAHKISKKNIFLSEYKRGAFIAAWDIVKLSYSIKEKCIKLSQDVNRLDGEKKSNLKSILNYVNNLYDTMDYYHILDTKQEKCLLDVKYKISTMIYNNDYKDYNKLLHHIPYKMALYML